MRRPRWILVGALAAAALAPSAARAGTSTNCAPGSPMQAFLSAQAPAPVAIANIGTSEGLQYTPPSTSMLVGGSLHANLYGDGYGPIPNFTITAPGLLPERVELIIRSGRGPIWKLL